MRTKPVVGIAAAVALAAAAITAWALWPDREPYPDQPEGVWEASEARYFDDVAVMTATSSLLIKGTVTGAAPGETVTLGDGSGSEWTDREVSIEVEEVLFNRYEVDAPETVTVIEGHWEDGIGYAREGMTWSEPGDAGYFYLSASPPEREQADEYSLISSYGRVLINADQEVTISDHWQDDGPWLAEAITDPTAAEFERVIREAASAADRGEAEPVPITVCEPSIPGDEDSDPICWEE